MTGTNPDERFLRRVVDVLGQGSATLTAEDAVRLRRARARALEPRRRPGALPVAGLAIASLAALIVGLQLLRTDPPVEPLPGLQHLELLAGNDSLQFYEDLEFLQWLERSGHDPR